MNALSTLKVLVNRTTGRELISLERAGSELSQEDFDRLRAKSVVTVDGGVSRETYRLYQDDNAPLRCFASGEARGFEANGKPLFTEHPNGDVVISFANIRSELLSP